jgi:hypothetical protein
VEREHHIAQKRCTARRLAFYVEGIVGTAGGKERRASDLISVAGTQVKTGIAMNPQRNNSPLIILILVSFIGACAPSIEMTSPADTAEPIFQSTANSLLPPTITNTVTEETPASAQYEILSPLSIRKDNFTIEVTSYSITSSIFRFGIRIIGLLPSQIPKLPPGREFSPIREVKFLNGDQKVPLKLELFGGGGGGGQNDDGTITISQGFSYRLVSPPPTGEKQHIIALVTLHETFGITNPIRFDLMVIPDAVYE